MLKLIGGYVYLLKKDADNAALYANKARKGFKKLSNASGRGESCLLLAEIKQFYAKADSSGFSPSAEMKEKFRSGFIPPQIKSSGLLRASTVSPA